MEIDSLLPVLDIYREDYLKKIDIGKQHILDKSINVLCLARDIGHLIEKNCNTLCTFLQHFCKSYNIIFFENDSKDNTKFLLENISKKNNNIQFISQNNGRQKFGQVKNLNRIIYLAEYRNSIRDIAKNVSSDYTIVLDSDFEDFSTDGLLNSFGWLSLYDNITAVAGNSFEYRSLDTSNKPQLWNYDSWAYRGSWWNDFHAVNPVPINSIDPMFWFGLWILPVGSPPITVNSAFGGCCIYRSKYYNSDRIKYQSYDCEHVCLHYDLQQLKDFRLVLNPSQRMLFI